MMTYLNYRKTYSFLVQTFFAYFWMCNYFLRGDNYNIRNVCLQDYIFVCLLLITDFKELKLQILLEI